MRRAASLLGGVLGLLLLVGLAAALVYLVPAHRQIEAIDPPIPTPAEVRALKAAGPGPVSIQAVNTASQGIGHPAYLIEWPDGRLFMIDAGMDEAGAREFGRPMELAFGADPIAPHGSVADQLPRETLRRIAAVAFTHLHIDHTGGLVAVCEAHGGRLQLFQTRRQSEQHNHTTASGWAAVERAGCASPRALDAEGLTPVPGFPGLYLAEAGGHTPGSTILVAVTPDRTWVFSGDLTNGKAALLEDRPKPWAYSLLFVPEATERLGRLRRALARIDAEPGTTVVVAHDVAAAGADGVPVFGVDAVAGERSGG